MWPSIEVAKTDSDSLYREELEEEELSEDSIHGLDIICGISDFIVQHKPGEGAEIQVPIRGAYNIFYPVRYGDGTSVGMRVPCEGSISLNALILEQFNLISG